MALSPTHRPVDGNFLSFRVPLSSSFFLHAEQRIHENEVKNLRVCILELNSHPCTVSISRLYLLYKLQMTQVMQDEKAIWSNRV